MAALEENGFDVKALSNQELFERLKNMGVNVGPVVDSTRKVYEWKLRRLLNDDINESTSECPDATTVTSGNHAGILKSALELHVPRIRTARRSVTIITTPEQLLEQLSPEEISSVDENHTRRSQSYTSPSYFVLPTPRQALHTGDTPTNTSAAEFRKFSMHSTSIDSMTCRETVLNNNFDEKKTNLSAAPLQKTNPLFITVFEVFIISFLVIVGYVFYQEVISFTQAEKEFLESNALNAQDM